MSGACRERAIVGGKKQSICVRKIQTRNKVMQYARETLAILEDVVYLFTGARFTKHRVFIIRNTVSDNPYVSSRAYCFFFGIVRWRS